RGIYLNHVAQTDVGGNSVSSSGAAGIEVAGPVGGSIGGTVSNTVNFNFVQGNASHGILLNQASGNRVQGNTVLTNQGAGIALNGSSTGATGNVVVGNRVGVGFGSSGPN